MDNLNNVVDPDQYTRVLQEFAESISPEDETYETDLMRVAAFFRTFGAALTSFLVENGYKGDETDNQCKIEFLKTKFKEKNISTPRGMEEWFETKKRVERKTAFQICFAFSLNIEQTNDFFRRVYFERGFDCHCIEEAVYYFCIKNQLCYQEAVEMLSSLPKIKQSKIPDGTEILYTGTIVEHIKDITQKEDMLAYLEEHIDQFGYNNATAAGLVEELWNQIARDGGVAFKEGQLVGKFDTSDTYVTEEQYDSEWNVLAQIFGLDKYWHNKFAVNRSIKPVLLDNALIPPLAEASFPDRDAVNKVLNKMHVSNERMRKLLILLVFYSYWAKFVVENKDIQYQATKRDAEKCVFSINKYLLDAGYPELYMGNPYDWIFLWAINDLYPLMTFRDYMREIFAYKSENNA